jgi:16S rRNA (guanine527-N7)-methyltransferase
MDPVLLETLRDAQRLGLLGDRPIEEAAAHSMAFVEAIGDLPRGARIVDLGSGGGLPGLVLAHEYPDAEILLVDRRQKRTDFLERAVRRLGWAHVVVRCDDVSTLRGEPAFDVVTARGFGPPAPTLRIAAELVAATGRIVISEPPSGDRWPVELLRDLGLSSVRQGAVRVFRRWSAPPDGCFTGNNSAS